MTIAPAARRGADEEVYLEELPLSRLAAEVGTPFYAYSKQSICSQFDSFKDAFAEVPSLVCVSVKANSNLALLSMLAQRGAGFDVVSGGELERVCRAGGDPSKVVFAGVGKTNAEILSALRRGIMMFNVESAEELEQINALAEREGKKAPVALRVNPDVDAGTHAYISTGMEEHKFGIPLSEARGIYERAADYPHLDFVGVDCHIGSMITDLSAFAESFQRVREFVLSVRDFTPGLRHVDVGGGLAVSYDSTKELPPSIQAYAQIAKQALAELGLTIVCEPGRAIFANAGILVSKVLYRKSNTKKQFVILDAGFNDLIRPTLYEAYHEIEPVKLSPGRRTVSADIVGPICESGDCFACQRELPELERGEFVAIYSAGAYGFSMASNYNTRPRPVEVLVDAGRFHVIRRRETLESLLEAELEVLREIEPDLK